MAIEILEINNRKHESLIKNLTILDVYLQIAYIISNFLKIIYLS